MTPYQEYIAKSRYSKHIPEQQRREHWPETVDRWIHFFQNNITIDHEISRSPHIWGKLRQAFIDLQVLPSMRAVMMAGPALAKTHIAGYNCSYTPVDDLRVFDEVLYILMCGTGVGFSVERKYVDQLPTIPEKFTSLYIMEPITVEDTKESWALSYRELVGSLAKGILRTWDTSRVRPKGAILRTSGGRASGPEPLVELFEFTTKLFTGAAGRKLTSMEVHDIMCKIGDVVIVGGVRRSALISLGDVDDVAHCYAKNGNWYETDPIRSIANNSAVYHGRPSYDVFQKNWQALIDSRSGERGIFNRRASQLQAAKHNKRPEYVEYGTNPCSEIILSPSQFCNLSTVIARPTDTESSLVQKVILATIAGTLQAALTKNMPILREKWKIATEAERLLGVSISGIYECPLLNTVGADTANRLLRLRDIAHQTNRRWAEAIGITPATAITCVKPEGTVSQLTGSTSGIHPGHSKYYVRRVRQNMMEPLCRFMIESGVPWEPCKINPDEMAVFSFPMSTAAITRDQVSAIEHLKLWLQYQRYWCDHKPSVTISVKDNEWDAVGDWVWEHFDECTGISFLPYDMGSYEQTPYEEVSEEEYIKLTLQEVRIDWSSFVETEDNIVSMKELACTANGCTI